MPSFARVGNTPSQNYFGSTPVASRVAVAKAGTRGSSGGFGYTGSANSMTTFSTDRYAPNVETLEKDSLLDDITPKTDYAQVQLFNRIYRDDSVAGQGTDMIATLPWSDLTLSGIDDPAIMRIYEESLHQLDPVTLMPEITREFLKFGRHSSTLIFDEDQGTWADLIPHDPQYLEINPIPIRGTDPKIDWVCTPEMRQFLESKDDRDKAAQARLPMSLRRALLTGKAALDPATTLFVPRRVNTFDFKGTSLYFRILPYYAIEKHLQAGTITMARRRIRSILHASAGIDNQWEPTPEEMDEIQRIFVQTEEDPTGAIVVTRNGIQVSEYRSGGDFWKLSEEQDSLRAAKLAALGLSDTFLTGEASYTTTEATLSVFMESIKVMRSYIAQKVFEHTIFDRLARAHQFIRRTPAELAHGVRTTASMSFQDAMDIPRNSLLLPTIHWNKNLSPESDTSYIDILEKIEGHGVPIPLKTWAAAGGQDLSSIMEQLPEDAKIRDQINKLHPDNEGGDGGGGGGGGDFDGAFSSVIASSNVFVHSALRAVAYASGNVGSDQPVLDVTPAEFSQVISYVTANNKRMQILKDHSALSRYLGETFGQVTAKVEGAKFMLNRLGFSDVPVSRDTVERLANLYEAQARVAKQHKNRDLTRLVRGEIIKLTNIYNRSSSQTRLAPDSGPSASVLDGFNAIASSMSEFRDTTSKINLYSGLG